jgi:PKD repeat protein
MTTTSSLSLRRTLITALALAVIALTATAHPAGAAMTQTTTGDDGPHIPPPVAAFTVSPNPALVNTLPVATTSTTATATAARVLVAPGSAISLYGNGDNVAFNASASHGTGGIVSYQWDLDGNGSFETVGGPVAHKRFFRTGTFMVRLRVTDGEGDSSVIQHSVIVHRAPTAHIYPARTTWPVNTELKLSPSGSTGDPDLVRFAWDFNNDGTPEIVTSNGGVVPVSYSTPGPHTLTLTVTDSYGATATTSLTLNIVRRPAAVLTVTPSVALIGQTVTFDASQSTSADSPIVDYRWDLDGDGNYDVDTGNVPTLSHRYTSGLRADVGVLVVDADGFGSSASQELTVQPVQTLPRTHRAKVVKHRKVTHHGPRRRVAHVARTGIFREYTKHPSVVTVT